MNQFAIAIALTASLTALGPNAQLDKDASDAVGHKIDDKRADSDAKTSGPVGKAAHNLKSGGPERRAKNSATQAKKAPKHAG